MAVNARTCEELSGPPAAAFSGYRLVDYLTQGYLGLTALLAALFHGPFLPRWPLYVAAHVACMAAVHLLLRFCRRPRGAFMAMLRCFYPMILYTFLYCETHRLDRLFLHHGLDGFFIDLDQMLFGQQLSRTLMEKLPYAWVSETFYLFYFSYYVMVFGVGLLLYLGRRSQILRYVTIVSFVFYVCYLVYIFLPVMGPHGTEVGTVFTGRLASVGPRLVPEAIQRGLFFQLMKLVYRAVEPEGGAAFPSSHVAVAVATLWFTWSYFKRLRWLHLIAVIMLCLSTVYCGYHYAVDVVGGLITAALLVPLAHILYLRVDGGTRAPREPSHSANARSAGAPRPCP